MQVDERFELLGIYLNDHLMGAFGGTELARRIAAEHRDGELRRLAADIAEDRDDLLRLMRELGVPVRRYRQWLGVAGERLGRVKLNGRLFRRSPLSDLLELEAMRAGVEGKTALWRALRPLAADGGPLDAAELDRLAGRARAQAEALEVHHASVSAGLFPPGAVRAVRAGHLGSVRH
ncbi:hypothetical protein OG689_39250 [Kitasatospora sp. NBC_00240]|uniref:hypothetical protein n=1 Tax=Kitasatospora sp. NBC_00240 TaxID=2903567 RepID=UPI002252A917|nr:hypothetical protein [Kitasatospora sp. NBC_00240]MCX5215232.1 hypothetical protein [Kitasatospora sp. NBC_00240]